METKLTLKLDQMIIAMAKLYASEKKLSLSRFIENYLNSLASSRTQSVLKTSPFVKSMSSKVNLPPDYDYKNNRAEYLTK